MVLGHEPAGIVVESAVSGISKGDHVILEPALYCYHCEYCLTGRHNVCANLKFLSTPEEPGFFRDYVDLPLHNMLLLPSNLSLVEGALAEPLSIILHSMEFAQPRAGETAVAKEWIPRICKLEMRKPGRNISKELADALVVTHQSVTLHASLRASRAWNLRNRCSIRDTRNRRSL